MNSGGTYFLLFTSLVKPTTLSDWQITLELTDPSQYSSNGARLHVPLKVNCFKPQKHWLPHPVCGDVVILRDLKVGFRIDFDLLLWSN